MSPVSVPSRLQCARTFKPTNNSRQKFSVEIKMDEAKDQQHAVIHYPIFLYPLTFLCLSIWPSTARQIQTLSRGENAASRILEFSRYSIFHGSRFWWTLSRERIMTLVSFRSSVYLLKRFIGFFGFFGFIGLTAYSRSIHPKC